VPDPEPNADPTWNTRELRDPAELRALTHPARLRILEALAIRGPSTATELAELVDESPANCSWHLRQLARYRYIEEAGGGTGRQRPWKIVPRGHTWADRAEPAEPDLALAEDAATEIVVDREYAALREWINRRHVEPAEWRAPSLLVQNVAFLTPDELADLGRALSDVIIAHPERLADPAARPPGARPVRLMVWGFPTG
jgi:DNA-binding transcriptional ArsR family regulator